VKLTVPASVVLFIILSLLFGSTSFSRVVTHSTKGYIASVSIQPEEIVITSKNYQLGCNYAISDPALLNAGENILFSTILSKASVELPSLATGLLCPGKNKVPGEATNLPFVKV